MSGWLKLLAILLMIGTAGYRYYHHGSLSAKASTPTSATATQAAQVAAPAPSRVPTPDEQYLTTYVQSIQRADRSYPYGTTERNIGLPSGKAAKLTIQKTKTGWCPRRKEDLYSMSIGIDVR